MSDRILTAIGVSFLAATGALIYVAVELGAYTAGVPYGWASCVTLLIGGPAAAAAILNWVSRRL